ncbi:MAG: TIGR02710 family CRISPR-associated CARF protein [Verrucomicrobiota bacterium]
MSTKAVLVTIGGSPTPILHTLREKRPSHIWYFCSEDSRDVASTIHAQLGSEFPDQIFSAQYLVEEQFEELNSCYKSLRRWIPTLLAKFEILPDEVLVDYTGGTKSMSAALVLAGAEFFHHFSYVGSTQRGKKGLGITMDGHERMAYHTNPWAVLAVREIERIEGFWNGFQFEPAATLLRTISGHLPRASACKLLAFVADALAARHRLDIKGAISILVNLSSKVPAYPGILEAAFDGRDSFGLVEYVQSTVKLMQSCRAHEGANSDLLRELLDNALRTATQDRFEDAAARLYRAIEMQGQLWLSEKTHGLFKSGKCLKKEIPALYEKVPALKENPDLIPNRDGDIKLGLEQVFRCLEFLKDPRVTIIAADIAKGDQSTLRKATDKRNQSILAHGTEPVGEDGFKKMKTIAQELLGMDMTKEAHPFIAFDRRWLGLD